MDHHCHAHHCHNQNYQPYTCHNCQQTYCDNHQYPQTHNCQTIQCPLCYQQISYQSDQNSDQIWEQHYSNVCAMRQPQQCQAQGCQTTFPGVNPINCMNCHRGYCLDHGYPTSHQCTYQYTNQQQEKCQVCGMQFQNISQLVAHSQCHQQ